MALDYLMFLEEPVEIATLLSEIVKRVRLCVSSQTPLRAAATDQDGSISVWLSIQDDNTEIPFPEFMSYVPKVKLLARFDKEKRSLAKQRLAELAGSLLDLTSGSVTVLIDGDILLLQRAAGRPLFLASDFWSEEMKALLRTQGGN